MCIFSIAAGCVTYATGSTVKFMYNRHSHYEHGNIRCFIQYDLMCLVWDAQKSSPTHSYRGDQVQINLISQEKYSQYLIDWSDPRAYLDVVPKIRIRAPAEKLTQVV